MRGLIPDEIIDRRKQGFGVPVNKWFNHELRDMLHDTLSDSKTRQRGYFSQRGIDTLLEEHRRGRRDNSRHLWTLLTLELWHRAYIDGDRQRSEVRKSEIRTQSLYDFRPLTSDL